MSISLIINGQTYFYPETGDVAWGADATDWAEAVTSGMLQKAGGLFLLLSETDFGPNYGLKSIYYKSRSADIAESGVLRLSNTDTIAFRNYANNADLALSVNSSNELLFNGAAITAAVAWGDITGTLSAQTDLQTALDGKVDENAPITGATKTKITYDAKGLVTSGADATTADITDSSNKRYVTDAQLVVIGNTSGVNTGDQDLSTYVVGPASATDNAIARYNLTTGKLIQNSSVTIDDSGNIAGKSVALSDSGSGVLLDLTQSGSGTSLRINNSGSGDFVNVHSGALLVSNAGNVSSTGTITGSNLSGTNTGDQTITLTGNVTGSGTGSFATTIASGVITNSMIGASAAIAVSKLAATTASRALASDASGFITASATTSTELGYVSGVTSSIQTQLNGKQATGNYVTALTGDVTASGPGSVAATIANSAVTLAKMANLAANSIIGNNTGGAATPIALSTAQTTAMLNAMVGDSGSGGTKGLVPAPASGDAAASKFLKADGTWATTPSGFSNPMTTEGDLILATTAGAATRLAIGTSGYVLTSNGTTASWAASAGGFTDPMTTRGDIIIRNASNTTARLGIGANTYVLTSDGTDIAWAAPSGGSGITQLTGDVTAGPGSGSQAATIASGVITNTMINASAAIAYSKLATMTSASILLGNVSNVPTVTAVTGDITISNAGVTSIASGVIVDADISAAAAIAWSKMADLTTGRALVSDGSGDVSVATTTATEIGYVNGVTSSIQTQLNTKMANPMTTGGDVIYGGASGTPARLANGTAGQILMSSGTTSAPVWADTEGVSTAVVYRTILEATGSHIAARAAGTYALNRGSNAAAVTGTGTLYVQSLIRIDSSDYPLVNGSSPTMRIKAVLTVNNVTPTGNFTVGLYPVTRPASSGGTGLSILTMGSVVSGSTVAFTGPVADDMLTGTSSAFAIPADGYYVVGFVSTATVATSSLVWLAGDLQVLTSAGGVSGKITMTDNYSMHEDFPDTGVDSSIPYTTGYLPFATNPFEVICSGTDAVAYSLPGSFFGSTDSFGVVALSTGSDSTGFAYLYGGGSVVGNGGETIYTTSLRISDLATVGQDYVLQFGLASGGAAPPGTSAAAYFEYNRSTSVNWKSYVSNLGSTNTTTSSTAVAASSFLRFSITINAGATSTIFAVNGVTIATETTHTPTVNYMRPFVAFYKTAGTTPVTVAVDYISVDKTMTAPR